MNIEKGFYRFVENELELDLTKLEEIFDKNYGAFPNKNYKNVASIDSSKKFETNVKKIFETIDEKFKLNEQGYQFNKVWFVQSHHENCNKSKLPFIPHIDKERFLKIMIYVTDVTEKDGPFCCISKDFAPETYEEKRQSLGISHKVEQENRITEFEESSYQPVIGKRGDVIMFDTNVPHYAGVVAREGERKVIRFDFELESWNKTTMRKKLLSLFR